MKRFKTLKYKKDADYLLLTSKVCSNIFVLKPHTVLSISKIEFPSKRTGFYVLFKQVFYCVLVHIFYLKYVMQQKLSILK